MADRGLVYDIAMSFAGAQRAAVERIVRACEHLGVTVFYDQDHTAQLWGNDIIGHMRTIYGGNRARYVVPFLSKEYLTSGYPMDELRAAISHGISIGDDSYILPVVVGDVDVPAELVSRDIGFLRLEDHSADELAHIIAERVSGTHNPHHRTGQTRPITGDRSRRRSIWLTLAFTVVVLGTGSVVGATLWARATAASGSTPPDPARGARGLSPTATAPASASQPVCSDFPVEVSLPEQVGSSGAVTFDIHCPPGGGDVYLPIMQRTSLGENAHPEYYPMRHSLPLEVNTPLSYTVDTDDDVSGSSICVYVIEPTRSQYDDILGSLDASDQLLSIPDSIQRVSAQECTRRQ